MNVGHLKILTWLAVTGVGGYVGYQIYDFKMNRDVLSAGPSTVRQKEVLDGATALPEAARDIVPYELISKTFVGLNWTGKPDPIIVPKNVQPDVPAAPPQTAVADLLRILFIRFDGAFAPGSLIVAKYVDPDLTRLQVDPVSLVEGDRLPSPYDGIFVESILEDSVRFGFDEEGREAEEIFTARPVDDERIIAKVGEAGVLDPNSEGTLIPQSTAPDLKEPLRTTQVGKNIFRIGVDDARYFEEHWGEVVSQIGTSRYKNPTTGKYEGVKITSITPGSVLERHGAREGMIIKSINGKKVTSEQEALDFAKKNDDTYDRWEIVYEEFGREDSFVYEEPGS